MSVLRMRPGSPRADLPIRGGIGSPRSQTSRVEMKTKKAASPAARRTKPRAAASAAAAPEARTAEPVAATSPGGELAAAEAATIDVTFADLGLTAPMLKALSDAGYQRPTPIQAQAVPLALKGRDIIGLAMTGTGKTAAFVIPIIERSPRRPETHTRTHSYADARTLRPGGGEFPQIWQAFRTRRDPRLRWRRIRPAGEGVARRSGCGRRDARAACSTISKSRTSCSTRSKCWCSTKQTACSTWGLRRRSTGSSRNCIRTGRRCCSARRCRPKSRRSRANICASPSWCRSGRRSGARDDRAALRVSVPEGQEDVAARRAA